MLERDIQAKILKWLNKQPLTYAFKVAQGAYSQIGVSDIIACVNGSFVAFEVKRKGNKPTKLQINFINHIKECNGRGFVVYSLDEVKTIMEELL